jgi:hypothetical protein
MRPGVCIVVLALCIHVHGKEHASGTENVPHRTAAVTGLVKEDGEAITVEEARAQMVKAMGEWVKLSSVDYKVELVCAELRTVIESELKRKSPVPLNVRHVYVVQTNGKNRLDFDLDGLPAGFPPELRAMASEAVDRSETGRTIARLSPNSMKSAVQTLMSKEDFAVIKADHGVIHAEVNQVNEPFFRNRMIRTLRCQVDTKETTVSNLEFVFSDNSYLRVAMKSTPHNVPGRSTPVYLLSEARFVHNVEFGGLPPEFTVSYRGYTFLHATPKDGDRKATGSVKDVQDGKQ